MISTSLQDALNRQITNELSAAYFYLSVAGYFESLSLPGFANWMRLQHQEESAHAMKIFDFVTSRNGRVTLGAIDAPASEFDSVEAAVGLALEHERRVTADIFSLHEVAQQERDYAAHVLLEWFQMSRWRRRRRWRSFWTTFAWLATTGQVCCYWTSGWEAGP